MHEMDYCKVNAKIYFSTYNTVAMYYKVINFCRFRGIIRVIEKKTIPNSNNLIGDSCHSKCNDE